MEISKEALNKRLNSNSNLLNSLGIAVAEQRVPSIIEKPIVTEVTKPVKSQELRVVAGTLAHFDTKASVAAALNLTVQQVDSAKNSNAATLEQRVKTVVDSVSELALTKVMDCLGLLSVDALCNEKPKELANIAANLSRVHSNVRRTSAESGTAPVFVIHAPTMNTVNNYEKVNA